MGYFEDPHNVYSQGYQPPGRNNRADPPPPAMTIAGRTAEQDAAARAVLPPQPETALALAFQGYVGAVDAQNTLNAQADAEFKSPQPTLTEQGWREKKATIQNSPAARVVDLGEEAVKKRQAESHQAYDELIAAMVQPGDAAQEQRNSRYAQRVQRKMEDVKESERIQVALQLMETAADPAQRGVLCEELPSYFADASFMEAKWRELDPAIADAAADRRRADQAAAMSKWTADTIRHSFKTGSPATQVGKLAAAVPKYDPDQNR